MNDRMTCFACALGNHRACLGDPCRCDDVSLSAYCSSCAAWPGELCAKDHPCPARVAVAIGAAEAARRQAETAWLRSPEPEGTTCETDRSPLR